MNCLCDVNVGRIIAILLMRMSIRASYVVFFLSYILGSYAFLQPWVISRSARGDPVVHEMSRVNAMATWVRQQSALRMSAEAEEQRERPYFRVELEYCPGCRWLLRAGWLAQELLTTFEKDIDEVAIKPSKVSGTFNVKVNGELVFSRQQEGRFPEAKEVKQLVRNIACPEKGLGHSDSPIKAGM